MLKLSGITSPNMSAKKQLARMVNPHRANLIKWFSYQYPGSSAQAAEQLTKIAIENNYISRREAPPGESLKLWVTENTAPQWACRAAFDFLVQHDWLPDDDIGRAISARYLVLNGHDVTAQWREAAGHWLDLALRAQRENS